MKRAALGDRLATSSCASLGWPMTDRITTPTNNTAVAPHVHHLYPCPICMELKKCRIVTPIRNTSPAISQL